MAKNDKMDTEYYQSNSVMTIKFGGTDEINTKLFTEFVDNTSFLLEESTRSIIPDAKIKLNISAIRPGSFVFDLNTLVDAAPLTKEVFSIAASAVGVFLGILQIKKLLKGNKPDSIVDSSEKVIIKKNTGTVTVDKRTYNMYVKPEINVRVSNIFYDLYQDKTKESFEVKCDSIKPNHDYANHISIDSSEFHELAIPEQFEVDDNAFIESFSSETQLKIRKAILEGRSKWNFYNGTRAIDAAMLDEVFLLDVKKGKLVFSCGDRLNVTLKTEYQIDEFGVPVKNTEKFSVLKVHELIKHSPPEDRQNRMFK